jgi:hypothetical protein
VTALKRTSALVAHLGYDQRIEDEVRKVREQLRKTLPGR